MQEDFSSESLESLTAINDPLESLTEEDKREYMALQESFRTSQSSDRHTATFQQEISRIVRFVDICPDRREQRALAAGLIYTGTYFCVNTQQLRKLICRCKSSINNGFQQLGFVSLKMKAKAQSCLLSALPCLMHDAFSIRQWTVRTSAVPSVYGFHRNMSMSMSMSPVSPVPRISQRPHRIDMSPNPLPTPLIPSHHTVAASAPVKKTELTETLPSSCLTISDEPDPFSMVDDMFDDFGDF